MFNHTHEEQIAESYTDVRMMAVKYAESIAPLQDIGEILEHWTAPSKGEIILFFAENPSKILKIALNLILS